MRAILLVFNLLIYSYVYAQKDAHLVNSDFSTDSISAMEQSRHSKLFSARSTAALASTNFDVKYYRGEWEVDPAINYIKGKLTAYYVMTEAGNSISFDLSGALSVSQVLQRNTPLVKSQTGDVLQITFPANVAVGTLDSVSIIYEGVPVSSGNGSFIKTTHGSPAVPVIWTLSEPFGSKDWWPCKNGLDDKADDGIDIFITHPNIYKAAANGVQKSETPIAGNKTVTHWKHQYAIASYLVCFAVTNYTVFNNSVTIGSVNLPMQTHCYPESLTAFQNGTQNTLDGLQLFSNLFGTYPFITEKYGHVQFGWNGGMEHQTSSFMFNLSETLVMHELAHQWFGNKITCGSWEDIWLNEGFATHLASIYMENKYPATTKTTRASEINFITGTPGGSVKVDDVTNVSRIFSNRYSYYKGSHLLYMLRWILSDAVFFTAVRNYLDDPALAFNFAKTQHLKAHLESASGKDLTYFFDQWYSGQGYPSYQLEWSTVGNSARFKLNQTTSHASVGFFQLPVPLLFKNEGGTQQKLVVANNTSSGQSFIEDLGFIAESVEIDPDFWLITRNNSIVRGDPLPVVFTYTKVGCVGEAAQISWGTTSEKNASHFEVEKSSDAIRWSLIASLDAAGNSTEIRNYSFTDQSASSGKTYYRIAEHDLDGTVMYTRVLQSNCGSELVNNLFITPNPAYTNLELHNANGIVKPISYRIFDILGRKVFEGKRLQTQGSIPVAGLTSGLYILQLETGKGDVSRSFRFVKN
ncbi:M1 family aminopeptidase [Dyadobacter sp. CY312]|uniref:M1 family aminopeptidase n=1 Tax=Dyadobacter sp. CY312 TaxID=2907303 RepID=UPI001F201F46|nr:M1 family aminopeptidase [Dyadobacter sp. CY312]MCE7044128.1 T9SS type A sorting domain-containing protein [Dyadobacter sp. CY312]